MKNTAGLVLLHITGCIAFLSLPVLLSPDVPWNFRFIKLQAFREDFISYTLLLLFFYLNYFYFLPSLYFRQKFLLYAAGVVMSYAVIAFLPHLIIPGNHATHLLLAEPGHAQPPPGYGMPGDDGPAASGMTAPDDGPLTGY